MERSFVVVKSQNSFSLSQRRESLDFCSKLQFWAFIWFDCCCWWMNFQVTTMIWWTGLLNSPACDRQIFNLILGHFEFPVTCLLLPCCRVCPTAHPIFVQQAPFFFTKVSLQLIKLLDLVLFSFDNGQRLNERRHSATALCRFYAKLLIIYAS